MQSYISQLKQRAVPEKVDGYSKTIGHSLEVWGTPVPEIRAVAKHLTKQSNALEICQQLWSLRVRETRILASVALQGLARKKPAEVCGLCVKLSQDLCNWEETDQLSVALWESCYREDQVEQVGRLLATKDNPWQKRLAIVFLIRGLRKAMVRPEYVEELFEMVHEEKGGLMRKAMAWVLREMSKSHAQAALRLKEKYLKGRAG